MAKKFFFIIVYTLMSLTMSAQWYGYSYGSRGGHYGYHQRRYNPAVRHQRMIRQQRQQMRLSLGQRVYFSGGCYYYYNGMRVINAVPQPRVYIYSKTQMCDAMNAVIMRTLLNGHFVFVHDPQTGELTQLTLQEK